MNELITVVEDKAILDVNEEYHQMTRYSFKVKENKYYE